MDEFLYRFIWSMFAGIMFGGGVVCIRKNMDFLGGWLISISIFYTIITSVGYVFKYGGM